MKLPTFLGVVATVAVAVSGTTYTLNQVYAKGSDTQTQIAQADTGSIQTRTVSNTQTQLAQAETQEVQFICSQGYDPDTQEQVPTTYAWTPKGKIAIIRWQSDWFKDSGFTPERRCNEVSPRFDTAYQNGNLNYLTNGRLNDQKVICAVSEEGDNCTNSTLILTLRPEDNEFQALTQLNSILQGEAGGGSVRQSSEKRIYLELDIDNFLATAPVEAE